MFVGLVLIAVRLITSIQSEQSVRQGSNRIFMPAINEHGIFHEVVPLSSSDASKWLRQLLVQAGQTPEQVSGITSHALKAIVLSWMAKAGKDPFHRKVAGYHRERALCSRIPGTTRAPP